MKRIYSSLEFKKVPQVYGCRYNNMLNYAAWFLYCRFSSSLVLGPATFGFVRKGYPKKSTDSSYFPCSTSHFDLFSASIFQKQVEKAKVENFGPFIGRLLRERGLSRRVEFARLAASLGFRALISRQALSDDQCSVGGRPWCFFWGFQGAVRYGDVR